jgi:hypothetical protein
MLRRFDDRSVCSTKEKIFGPAWPAVFVELETDVDEAGCSLKEESYMTDKKWLFPG